MLTTRASSAPVNSFNKPVRWSYLLPLPPFSMSYSKFEYPVSIGLIMSIRFSGRGALPRFVLRIIPVAFMTFLILKLSFVRVASKSFIKFARENPLLLFL
ncbi:hypothetical protein ES703_23917 [subsurface metagenome]